MTSSCAPARQAGADAVFTGLDAGLTKQVSREKLTDEERLAILGRITVTDDLSELALADLVIESVVEDLAVKKALFAELDAIVQPDAILATNTSTLPVVELAMATKRPELVCGIHFFNPAPDDEARRSRPADHRRRRDDHDSDRVRRVVRQGRRRGQGPCRLHRQRPALPVPQQRGAHVGTGDGVDGRHRHRDAGRLQLPDGSVRAARPRRARHVAGHPRRALRRVPRPELRRGARPCAAWSPPANSAARPSRASTRTDVELSHPDLLHEGQTRCDNSAPCSLAC